MDCQQKYQQQMQLFKRTFTDQDHTLTISDEEIEYLIKIVQPIKDLGLLVKGINNFSQ